MRHADAGDHIPDDAMDRARHITPTGKAQAQDVAEQLAGKKKQPTAVISDDTNRCLDTAQIVADQFGFKVHVDTRMAETYTAGVISELSGDFAGDDMPGVAESRRYHGRKEKRRITPLTP